MGLAQLSLDLLLVRSMVKKLVQLGGITHCVHVCTSLLLSVLCDVKDMFTYVCCFHLCRSRAKNIMLFGILGGKEMLQGSQRGFENRVRLEVC